MVTFYCAGLLWYHVAHTLLYTNQVTFYYSENTCTNQKETIIVLAILCRTCMHMCKNIRADHSSLILILLKNKKTEPEQRVASVCSFKQSVNVTRATGTDADCSYMDKDSQFNKTYFF